MAAGMDGNDTRLTRWIGAAVFLIVFGIYFATMAPTTSFWDCGEFIACAFTMGVPHPPGTPLFIMIGRVFSLVPFEHALKAVRLVPPHADMAVRANIMSPLTGALAALFCYLIILRLIRGWKGGLGTVKERWSAQVGAVVGAFIFALADSNWFNAVEAEVYAYAIFFMMLALYLGLVWADTVGKGLHLSLALFLAYLMGLAGGLHLLALLVLPTIALLGVFAYVKDRRDVWVLLGAVTLLILGGYFALHAMNAARLLADPMAGSAADYGISDDPLVYRQISVVLALVFTASGIVLAFLTRAVNWRDTWSVLLIGAAAVATVKSAIDAFFWIEDVGPFPLATVIVGVIAALGLVALGQGQRKPAIPALKGYHLVVALLLLVVVGYSTYLMLMIRSGLSPSINENNPDNWRNLFSFIARKQYGNEDMSLLIFSRRASLRFQFWDMFVKYLLQQFPVSLTGVLFNWKALFRAAMEPTYFGMRVPDLPLVLMLLGIFWHYEYDRRRFLALSALFVIAGFGLAVYLNMPDPQPRERDYAFTGAISVMAIWMGLGVTGLIRSAGTWLPETWPAVLRQRVLPYAIAAVGIAVPIVFLLGYPLIDQWSGDFSIRYRNWPKHDRRYDTIGYDYAYNILESCEPGGVIFTNGDNDTFPLWYLQEVVGTRKDVRVANLSLLNTDWYIEQLRDVPPRVPISPSYTDEYVENVLAGATLQSLVQSGRIDVGANGSPFDDQGRLIGWRAKEVHAAPADTILARLKDGRVLRGVVTEGAPGKLAIIPEGTGTVTMVDSGDVAASSVGHTELAWTIPPPDEYRVLRVQDVMVYDIIRHAEWKRPVYFAVTVADDNKIGLERYLRMEGMVFNLVYRPDEGLNVARSIHNLEDVYMIRNIRDESIYKDDNMLKLISNYRSAYLQLADKQIAEGDVAGAHRSLLQMNDRIPLEWRAAYTGASICRRAGTELSDLLVYYAKESSRLLQNEIAATDVFDAYMLERVRITTQLLRFANDNADAIALLERADRRAVTAPPVSGIGPFDRLMLLFELGRTYEDMGQNVKARDAYVQANAIMAQVPSTPEMSQQFQDQFRIDPRTMQEEIQRRLAHVNDLISRPESTRIDTSRGR